MAVPLTVVDSFTDRPFAGNPAGVCLLDAPAPDAWMQAVAAEVNLSETAFLVPRSDGDHDLRWFTPTVEVDLCGHATLASAHVLGGKARFHTRSGVLACWAGSGDTIDMDFPARPVDAVEVDPGWAAALGLRGHGDVVACNQRDGWLLVEAASAGAVRAARPDVGRLLDLGGHCLLVADTTTAADEDGDSVCRMFAPASGITEDPVTGSAHCVIGPWLASRTGRSRFVGHQASARGGTVTMRVEGDRVDLGGRAVTVFEGTLTAGPG